MKINVTFEHDEATGKEWAQVLVTPENGVPELMPCIRKVDVNYAYGELSEVVITLAVNRSKVTLGQPVKVAKP